MKKTAGILKFICSFTLVIEIMAAVFTGFGTVALLMVGSFSELAAKADNAVKVEASGLTPAEMDALKPVIIGALVLAFVAVIFALLGTLQTRKVLTECQNETPFSSTSVNSLKASARLDIIGGIVGIVGAAVLTFMASKVKVNGTSVGSSSGSLNLSFLIYALIKYHLCHVAEYGHRLENR